MAYRRLPDGVLDFVKENAEGSSDKELARKTNELFGTSFTDKSMKGYRRYHGIRRNNAGKPPSLFPPEIQEYIKCNCEGVPYREMTGIVNELFGTNFTQNNLRWFYQNNKLRCGVRWTGRKSIPGSVSQKKDDYQYIKLEDGTWRLYHHFLWEKANGPIPPGHVVTFLDGNIQNTDPSNLALVSRQEQMQIAKDNLRFDNPEFTKTGILIAKVKVATNQRKKRRRSDEQ